MDGINNLPDDVLQLILNKLSVVDQVRTSALSKSWRLKWTLVPFLEFGKEFYDCFDTSRKGVCNAQKIITNLLLQRSGLERLTIKSALSLYTLPYSVLCADGLTHLSLSRCQLCFPPSFRGLPNGPNLVSLRLEFCKYCECGLWEFRECTANLISRILSSCPQLQELKLGGLNCKDLTLRISAPKLRYLSLQGNLGNIYLEKAEDLEKMNLDLRRLPDGVAVGTSFQVFPDPCSKLCEIGMSNYVCKLWAHRGGHRKLPGLKKLSFRNLELRNLDVFRCVLGILACSPELTELRIHGEFKINTADISECGSLVEKYKAVTNLGHLKKVLIYMPKEKSLPMNIIELLLGISPVLEEMTILVFPPNGRGLKEEEEKQQILRQMLSCSRASINAKINTSFFKF